MASWIRQTSEVVKGWPHNAHMTSWATPSSAPKEIVWPTCMWSMLLESRVACMQCYASDTTKKQQHR